MPWDCGSACFPIPDPYFPKYWTILNIGSSCELCRVPTIRLIKFQFILQNGPIFKHIQSAESPSLTVGLRSLFLSWLKAPTFFSPDVCGRSGSFVQAQSTTRFSRLPRFFCIRSEIYGCIGTRGTLQRLAESCRHKRPFFPCGLILTSGLPTIDTIHTCICSSSNLTIYTTRSDSPIARKGTSIDILFYLLSFIYQGNEYWRRVLQVPLQELPYPQLQQLGVDE